MPRTKSQRDHRVQRYDLQSDSNEVINLDGEADYAEQSDAMRPAPGDGISDTKDKGQCPRSDAGNRRKRFPGEWLTGWSSPRRGASPSLTRSGRVTTLV